MSKMESIYEDLKATGAPMDSHESDLYVKKTPATEKIIEAYKYRSRSWLFHSNITTFTSQLDDGTWYDIPFAYQPWWDARVVKNKD